MYYAKNINWGELQSNGDITVYFDVFLQDKLLEEGKTITTSIDVAQDAIVKSAKGESYIAGKISYEEALGLYNDITSNAELFFE